MTNMKKRIELAVVLIFTVISCNYNKTTKDEINNNEIQKENLNITKNNIANCDSCWASNFSNIATDIKNVTEPELKKFLYCCNEECSNNVEFSEFSNGILYRLLQEKTTLIITVLENTKDIDINYILSMIENPIDDGIDLKKTREIIELEQLNSELKNRLIESINIAIKKGE